MPNRRLDLLASAPVAILTKNPAGAGGICACIGSGWTTLTAPRDASLWSDGRLFLSGFGFGIKPFVGDTSPICTPSANRVQWLYGLVPDLYADGPR